MSAIRTTIACLIFVLPLSLIGQTVALLDNIALGDPLEEVRTKVSQLAQTSHLTTIETPVFPLAKEKEDHLVCTDLKTPEGHIEKVVFTFADNILTYIEARGKAVEIFSASRKDTASTYLDYSFYSKDKLVLNKKKDIVWIMDEDAMHLNLFSWENPYLIKTASPEEYSSSSEEIPDFLMMGATINEIKPLIKANSKFISVDELSGKDPNAQIQINGFGVEYMGFPRKIEARFGDEILNVVWILTGKGEEDRIRKALVAQFGAPIYTNNEWEIYNDWQVGLRKDKPEVLLMKKEIGLEYKTSYFGQ